jgi:glycosyltransferase involved in cell wall biosynthesis
VSVPDPLPARPLRVESLAGRRYFSIVTETYPPEINGVALTLARLVDGLRARGHLVSVIRPRSRAGDRSANDDPDVTVVRGLPLPGYRELRVGLPAGSVLWARWTIHRPDVVYLATEGPLGWSAMRTAQRLEIPVFSGFHTNFHEYARHYRAGWLEPLILGYLRRFHNETRGTLVATTDLRDQIRALGFDNLNVIGRGVDRQLFTPARRSRALRASWGVADGDLVALYVGRIAAEKNLSLAIEAYRAMQATGRVKRFVVVGDGPQRVGLEATHPDLLFCGVQRDERLAAHYASADLFVFPSETETFGNVILESMASGLCVLAYDYAAARMHVRHGETGVLAPYRDSRAFVREAAALPRSPRLVAMRRRARTDTARLDWPDVVDRFERVLMESLRAD